MSSISPTNYRPASGDRRWTAIITIASIVVLSPGLFWGLPFGVNIMGAERILDGEVPYRDFWTMYAPGQFYLTAGLSWLFGRHVLVQGVAAVVLGGLAAGMLFRLVRRLDAPRFVAGLVSGVFALSLWSTSPELNSYLAALPCLLFAIERVIAYLQGPNRKDLWLAGALLGLAAWFKHDVAAYVAVASVAALLAIWLTKGEVAPKSDRGGFRAILVLIAASLAVALPVVLLLAWSAPADTWHDLIVFPATDFRGVRTEAYPSLVPNWAVFQSWAEEPRNVYRLRDVFEHLANWILCNVPQFVFVGGVGVLLLRYRSLERGTRAILVMWLVFLLLCWSAAHVQANTHLYSMAIASSCLGAMAWRASERLRTRRRVARVGLMSGLVVYGLGLMITPAMQLGKVIRSWPGSQVLTIPGVSGLRVSGDEFAVYQPIVDFIRRNVAEDERIYVGLKRHDATVIGNMRFYYLSRRRNCCRYDELHPGVTDQIDVQREIVDAIEGQSVRCVVLWDFGSEKSVLDAIKVRNAAAVKGAGSELLDRYIDATFEPVARYGEYALMWRKGLSYSVDDS